VFFALVVTVKLSVDQLFMHYFRNLSSASEGLAPGPHRSSTPGPHWWTFLPRPPNLPTPRKNHAGAHGYTIVVRRHLIARQLNGDSSPGDIYRSDN